MKALSGLLILGLFGLTACGRKQPPPEPVPAPVAESAAIAASATAHANLFGASDSTRWRVDLTPRTAGR